jgi:acyl carrier protein
MTSTEIEQALIDVLNELQAGTGEPPCEINSATVPLQDLGFFDSLLAIETTLGLEERLEYKCDEDNVFKSEDNGEPLTITEIAARLALLSKAAA